ncbi:17841_t:CDS:1, partial [Dentiscutata erythropus]
YQYYLSQLTNNVSPETNKEKSPKYNTVFSKKTRSSKKSSLKLMIIKRKVIRHVTAKKKTLAAQQNLSQNK